MLGHSSENLRHHFAGQFEPNKAGYLYRRGGRGAPVQVSAAERDAFVEQFDRRFRWGQRIGIAAILSTCAILVIATQGGAPNWWGAAVGGGVAAAMLSGYWWIRNTPARALERRPVVVTPLDRSEIERRALVRTTYPIFALGFLGCALLVYTALADGRPLQGWNPLEIAIATAMGTLLTRQFVRKIRLTRR